jgi:hypothetical protein
MNEDDEDVDEGEATLGPMLELPTVVTAFAPSFAPCPSLRNTHIHFELINFPEALFA